jgi:hypothetical protein
MSKFIDKLSLISQGGLKPMGFRAAGVPPKPRLLLVAHMAGTGAKATGADALLLSVPKTGAKSPKAKAAKDIPWGGWLSEVGKEGIRKVAEAGGDFVVFPAASASLAVLQEEKLGKILEVEPSLDPGLLKAIDDLPVDAVLITAEGGKDYLLTWRHLMLFQRAANILTKPLLAAVSPDVAASELQALWETGVSGVVVKAGTEGKLAKLRQVIDKLVLPSPGKRRKTEPLVPHIGGEMLVASEEEEE